MSETGTLKDFITRTLETSLAPLSLDVVDESHLHAGHGGWREEGETHFRLDVVSAAFEGKSRVDRQRLVNGLLEPAFQRGLHALAMRARAPSDAA